MSESDSSRGSMVGTVRPDELLRIGKVDDVRVVDGRLEARIVSASEDLNRLANKIHSKLNTQTEATPDAQLETQTTNKTHRNTDRTEKMDDTKSTNSNPFRFQFAEVQPESEAPATEPTAATPAPAKRRGRPPGAKAGAKKAKPAKAAKVSAKKAKPAKVSATPSASDAGDVPREFEQAFYAFVVEMGLARARGILSRLEAVLLDEVTSE